MEQLPQAQRAGTARVAAGADRPDRLERMEQVHIHPLEIPLQTAEPLASTYSGQGLN